MSEACALGSGMSALPPITADPACPIVGPRWAKRRHSRTVIGLLSTVEKSCTLISELPLARASPLSGPIAGPQDTDSGARSVSAQKSGFVAVGSSTSTGMLACWARSAPSFDERPLVGNLRGDLLSHALFLREAPFQQHPDRRGAVGLVLLRPELDLVEQQLRNAQADELAILDRRRPSTLSFNNIIDLRHNSSRKYKSQRSLPMCCSRWLSQASTL